MQLDLYAIILTIHSIVRWVILLTGLFAIIRAITGLSFRRSFMAMDNRAGMLFTSALDLQLLLGIILYFFLSPITRPILSNFGGAMSSPQARFFGVEHVAVMLLAIIVAHVTRVLAKRAPKAAQKHQRILIGFVITFVLIALAIPWPFMAGYGRPLL